MGRFCVVYLDDILIYSRGPEEHLQHVDKVLTKLQENKLHVNVDKCFMGRKRVEFLGHIVEGRQMEMDPKKITGFAIGAVLLKDQGNGLQPVAYHARKINKHE